MHSLQDQLYRYLYNRIIELWSESGVWSSYLDIMRRALGLGGDETSGERGGISRWATLPALCCQAAGGDPSWTGDLTLAWLLFYSAAHIMDSVQDEDEPESWWAEAGPAVALNTASGLYFTAGLCLAELADYPGSSTVKRAIGRDFYRCFLRMGSGQHRQFSTSQLDLDLYWETTRAKSGEFFALACSSGARLVDRGPEDREAYRDFGHNLGMLVQIADDLEDVQPPATGGIAGQRRELATSLPAIFTRTVLPEAKRDQFDACLKEAPDDEAAAVQALDFIDRSGAGRYILAELERFRQQAYQAWERAAPSSPAGDYLRKLVDRF